MDVNTASLPFLEPKLVRETSRVRVVDFGVWRWMVAKVSPPYAIMGKYLFLSRDQDQLERIAEREIVHNGFHRAKWSHTLNGTDYVLCLYYAHGARGRELALRAQEDGWECEPTSTYRWTLRAGTATTLRFRWWRSEESTEASLFESLGKP